MEDLQLNEKEDESMPNDEAVLLNRTEFELACMLFGIIGSNKRVRIDIGILERFCGYQSGSFEEPLKVLIKHKVIEDVSQPPYTSYKRGVVQRVYLPKASKKSDVVILERLFPLMKIRKGCQYSLITLAINTTARLRDEYFELQMRSQMGKP